MSQKMERRFIASEVRAETQDGKKVLTGYAAKYGKMSQDLGGFNEIIAPGTFDRAVKENQDVKMLINHDPNQIVGRNGKNLELTSDKVGLKFRVQLPNTQMANDLHENVRNGIMEECSFGFITKGDRWMDARDGGFKDVQYQGVEDKQALVRELTDVDLRDVSVVTSPAYPQTEVKARDKGVSALELRSLFPDGIPEEVATRMAEAVEAHAAKEKKVAEFRHDKVADIKALLPKVQEAMDSLEECASTVSDAIDNSDTEAYDEGNEELAKEIKALSALLGALEKAVDKENSEDDDESNEDDSRKMRLRLVETAQNM